MRPRGDGAATVVAVGADGDEVTLGRVDTRHADLRLVDHLARAQVAARRRGWRLRVRGAPPELLELCALCGLSEALGLEPGREPELREELPEQEVVEPGDAPA